MAENGDRVVRLPVAGTKPEDVDVPFDQSANYARAARAAGDPVELHEVTGDHFDVIDPSHKAYRCCRRLLERLLPDYPDIKVEVDVNDASVDIAAAGFDAP